MAKNLPLFIDGYFVESKSKKTLEVKNPVTQEILCHVPCASKIEIDKSISSASAAFYTWKDTPPPERARLMMAYQSLLKNHQDELAEILSKENGKTFEDAKGDVWRGIEVVEQAANIPSLLMGETLENPVHRRHPAHRCWTGTSERVDKA